MKVFAAGIATESNSFSSIPTGAAAFAASRLHGAEAFEDTGMYGAYLRRLRELAGAEGWEVIPGLFTFAVPGAPTIQSVYEEMRDTLLRDLRAAGAVDLVILYLHGAMMAQDTWDCEGDILAKVRECVGRDVPIGVVLDPHAHLTEAMTGHATILSFMKEYPHTDMIDRVVDVWRLCRRVTRGEIQPTCAVYDCRMVALWPTGSQPMRGFVDRMLAIEGHDGVLSISFIHGFPWGDTPVTGARVLVYTDHDTPKAAALAEHLGKEIWQMRDRTIMPLLSVDEAIDRMAASQRGLLVFADLADNSGGGAPGDSTFVLRAALDRGLSEIGFALFYDPQAALACHEAGLGATLALRVGGKTGPESGLPVDLTVNVMGLAQQGSQEMSGAGTWPLGKTAWVRARGMDLILASARQQCFDPTAFTHLGLDPTTLKAVVVKSTNHFRAGFDPIALETLYLDAPGAIAPNFATIPFKNLAKAYWPRVADPWTTHA